MNYFVFLNEQQKRKKLKKQAQVQENTAIIAKFAARLLLLIILIGVIIYALPSWILTPPKLPESHADYNFVVCVIIVILKKF